MGMPKVGLVDVNAPQAIAIEKGIPMDGRWVRNDLPFDYMEVGDSFAFPADLPGKNAYEYAARATMRRSPKRFAARMRKGKARVWRTA